MDVQARAGIDIYGPTLRYAEVEKGPPRERLLRLGRCTFDFDVAAALSEPEASRGTAETPDPLDALVDALTDVFDGSAATRLHVVVHPPHGYSFFTPLPGGVSKEERKKRLLRDAALLTRAATPQPLRLTADPVYVETLPEGERREWYHILALQERLHSRFDRIFRQLPQQHYRMTWSMHAVANALERLATKTGHGEAPFSLAIGYYPSHLEYTLCHKGRWYFSQFIAEGAASDSAFFALHLLARLGLSPEAVGQVLAYGPEPALDAFAAYTGRLPAPERLGPAALVDYHEAGLAAEDEIAAYVPCIGVAL